MAIIFEGNLVVREKEGELKKSVNQLSKKGVTPKLVTILVGDNFRSKRYISSKKKAAERLGQSLEIKDLSKSTKKKEIIRFIEKINKDKSVHGIMLQLPLPSNFSNKDRDGIINSIEKHKDVDGMRDDSIYVAPVVKSVLKAFGDSSQYTIYSRNAKIVIVGAKGFVGRKIVKILKNMNYKVKGVDADTKDLSKVTKRADVLISVTGVPGLIKENMVKEDVVIIDVGSPMGDVITKEIIKKAKFISPVPGGVGPLTIYYLLENLVEAAKGGEIAK